MKQEERGKKYYDEGNQKGKKKTNFNNKERCT